MVLIRNAEVGGQPGLDVRVGPDRIEEIGPGLVRGRDEETIDAAGGAVIPGLHDHHVHLRAAVATRQSVDAAAVADPAGFDALIRAAAAVQPGRWLRVTGWDEHRAGPLDAARLDALTGSVAARVQHRSGAMWVLNSAALQAVGACDCDQAGLERDAGGALTGRLLRLDDWLRDRLPAGAHADFAAGLAAYAAEAAALGVTGFTDATPGRDQADVDALGALAEAGALPQRLVLMAPPGLRLTGGRGRVALGPHKVILDDATLPAAGDLAAQIAAAHEQAAAVAVHCVTAEQLVVATAAFEQAGRVPALADRIEHAAVVPPGFPATLARLGLIVVTQPGFIGARGDAYLEHVAAAEQDWLYPCARLLAAGVAVAGSTDAPFGPADPWSAVAAALTRRTAAGRVLGPAERVGAATALGLFLADPLDPRRTRTVAAGQPADVCVLRAPLSAVLPALEAPVPSAPGLGAPALGTAGVLATVAGGRLFRA